MPVNKTGGYSGRTVQKTHTGSGQLCATESRSLNGQAVAQASARPPKTTGSAPTFQNKAGGNDPGGNKSSK